VWSVSSISGTALYLSAQMRDEARFGDLVGRGIEVFIDIAGAAPYVWRPGEAAIVRAGVRYIRVYDVEDTNIDLPDSAFATVAAALDEARAGCPSVVFCAAGLKRSPHLVYGVLRSWGYRPEAAWAAIVAARPFVDPWPPYLAAAERWLVRRTRDVSGDAMSRQHREPQPPGRVVRTPPRLDQLLRDESELDA
jgi:predicted protein tyrosine phosphatase